MLVNGKAYRTVWMEGGSVRMIEQRLLPHEFKIVSLATHRDTAEAIKTMVVRGGGDSGDRHSNEAFRCLSRNFRMVTRKSWIDK